MHLITYDVNTTTKEGKKRLQKIAKECCNYGQRVQNSVFECDLSNEQYLIVKSKLLKIINTEEDSLRVYSLGKSYSCKIEQFGNNRNYYDPEGELIV